MGDGLIGTLIATALLVDVAKEINKQPKQSMKPAKLKPIKLVNYKLKSYSQPNRRKER